MLKEKVEFLLVTLISCCILLATVWALETWHRAGKRPVSTEVRCWYRVSGKGTIDWTRHKTCSIEENTLRCASPKAAYESEWKVVQLCR